MKQRRQASTRLRLRVTTAAEKVLRSGHPWLFAESILEQNRPGTSGELAVIYDRKDRFLALALFDPDSPIRARVLVLGEPQTIDAAWWSARLEQALERRQRVLDDQTTGYRWIHGENDGWPGLVLDRYGASLVLKLYTAAWLPRLPEIVSLLTARLKPGCLVLRLSRNIQAKAKSSFDRFDGETLSGRANQEPVHFLENGLRFEADVWRGQKTGFFLDQRDNRRQVERFAANRAVLNAFSFSGAFSVYAARGGATSTTDLDISAHALESARRNFALNQNERAVKACRSDFIQTDAFEWLQQQSKPWFDLVILDPPSLAKRQADKLAALKAYENLAFTGLRQLRPRGILVACSCSAHVIADDFFSAVQRAVSRSGRRCRELQRSFHPPDHPATFPEAHYLKAVFIDVQAGKP